MRDLHKVEFGAYAMAHDNIDGKKPMPAPLSINADLSNSSAPGTPSPEKEKKLGGLFSKKRII